MTVKQPTPQGISALLKRAGFTRSEPDGRNGRCSGFLVSSRSSGDGARVRHYFRTMAGRDSSSQPQIVAAYAEAIRAAGWAVEAKGWELAVTAPQTEV